MSDLKQMRESLLKYPEYATPVEVTNKTVLALIECAEALTVQQFAGADRDCVECAMHNGHHKTFCSIGKALANLKAAP